MRAIFMVAAVATLACSQSERRGSSASIGASQGSPSEASLLPGPRVELVDSVHRLVLPDVMLDLLRDSFPSFQPWTIANYGAEIRNVYLFSHREAPWAVIGDFTGDGVQDVVVDGHDATRALRLSLISQNGRYHLLVLASSPLASSGLASSFLAFRAPGKIGTNFSDETFTLRADAFEVVLFEKAATLYYWDGTRFAEFATAD